MRYVLFFPVTWLDIFIELANDDTTVPSWAEHWQDTVHMLCTGTLFEIMLASDAGKMAYGAYQLSYDAGEFRKYVFHL